MELLGGLLFLAAFLKYNPLEPFFWSPAVVALLVVWIWISLMIVGSFIDFDHQLLPDFVTVGGMILGIVWAAIKSVWVFLISGWGLSVFNPLVFSVVGLIFGFGLLWFVRWIGSIAFKREAMGMGDVFLMGGVGAIFGPVAVLVTLILSSLFGSVIGVVMILISKTKLGGFTPIPYGPYICMGCLSWMFYGQQLVNWYLHLVRI